MYTTLHYECDVYYSWMYIRVEMHESLFYLLPTTSAPLSSPPLLPSSPPPSSLSLSSALPPPSSFSLYYFFPRTFKLSCHGTGILPSLELSENAINFAPTVVNNVRTTRVSLRNPKLGRLNSAVIRGAVLQQGPKAFEFVVPRGFPISVCTHRAEYIYGIRMYHIYIYIDNFSFYPQVWGSLTLAPINK